MRQKSRIVACFQTVARKFTAESRKRMRQASDNSIAAKTQTISMPVFRALLQNFMEIKWRGIF